MPVVTKLNPDQEKAMAVLKGPDNVFLTGEAGTGKSFVLQQFIKESDMHVDILATTGAAALIIDGRTFHSFFCLYKFDAGVDGMVSAALNNRRMCKRVAEAECIVIDEISMMDQKTMAAGEYIARITRGNDLPWGGLKVIAVGDFLQLPPVDPSKAKDAPISWVFDGEAWAKSNFVNCNLSEVVRTEDKDYLAVLQKVRQGICDEEVISFLNARAIGEDEAGKVEGTRLYPVRAWVDEYNKRQLDALKGDIITFETKYFGDPDPVFKLKKNAPIRDNIELKEGALVMIRENDPDGFPYRYVNGSLGHFRKDRGDVLEIELLDGSTVGIRQREYHSRNGDGDIVATAQNFPINLAWASTIHKAQGATMDCCVVDLSYLWEPGQAYVALSRTRKAKDLFVMKWKPESIFADGRVREFYSSMR